MRPITNSLCGAHGLLAMALVAAATLGPEAAYGVTFEEAAKAAWYTHGSTGTIDVEYMNMDDLAGVNNYNAADTIWAENNFIPGIDTNQFSGLTNLQWLFLAGNLIASIESGDFSGLTNLQELNLDDNALTHLNLSGADFVDLEYFGVVYENTITSVDLSEASLSDGAFRTLMRGFDYGDIVTMDLSVADLSMVADLSPMYRLHDLVTLDLPFAELPDVGEVGDLVVRLEAWALDNLTLSWNQWWSMHVKTRTALTDWDVAPANTLTIVPEPATLALLAVGTVGLLAYAWRRRRR